MLAQEPDVTAVFVFNDLMAFGVVNALRRAGRRVPDDVSVVGFDDILIARAMDPPLTTVAQPVAELGRRSVQLLLARLGNTDGVFSRIVLQTRLVERASTAPVAVAVR
jgi:DNA-binding LacI/PurR family transcriptional regulator